MVDGLHSHRTFVVCRALKAPQHLPYLLIHPQVHYLMAEAPMHGANLLIRGDAPHNISALSQSNNHSHTNRGNIKSTLGFVILPKGTSTFSQSQGSWFGDDPLCLLIVTAASDQDIYSLRELCARIYGTDNNGEISTEYKDSLQCLNFKECKMKNASTLFFIWKTYSIQLELQ